MGQAALQTSKETIFGLLAGNEFVIPEYQREYAWDQEKCEILWEDLTEHTESCKDKKNEGKEYFLGSIVGYEAQEKELEVIDGQQRIITFMLLLKAMYRKLHKMGKQYETNADITKGLQGLKRQIAPCIWEVDPIQEEPIVKNGRLCTRITTKVYHNAKYNEKLQEVLSNKDLDEEVSFKDEYNFVINYKFFINKVEDITDDSLTDWSNFIVSLKKSCIVLPIKCSDPDMGLRIFYTLNDRGMPLSDVDIFKHQLYTDKKHNNEEGKFMTQWDDLHELCNSQSTKIEMIDIFKYYMHIIRSEKSNPGNMIGMRSFYLDKNTKPLLNRSNIMKDIHDQAVIWIGIRNEFPNDHHPDRFKGIDDHCKKYLQILGEYPNEWWEAVVSMSFRQYDVHKLSDSLRKIVAALYFEFLKTSSVAYIKPRVYTMNNNIHNDKSILAGVFKKEEITKEAIKDVVKNFTSKKIVRGLLTLYVYLDTRQEYINTIRKLHIEHILPKKWHNYDGWNKKDADEFIDNIGNKVLCESKLNIRTGDNYFNQKKEMYKNSKIHELRSMSQNQDKKDWLQTDIEDRETKMKETFINFFSAEFHDEASV